MANLYVFIKFAYTPLLYKTIILRSLKKNEKLNKLIVIN